MPVSKSSDREVEEEEKVKYKKMDFQFLGVLRRIDQNNNNAFVVFPFPIEFFVVSIVTHVTYLKQKILFRSKFNKIF